MFICNDALRVNLLQGRRFQVDDLGQEVEVFLGRQFVEPNGDVVVVAVLVALDVVPGAVKQHPHLHAATSGRNHRLQRNVGDGALGVRVVVQLAPPSTNRILFNQQRAFRALNDANHAAGFIQTRIWRQHQFKAHDVVCHHGTDRVFIAPALY